MDQKIRKLLAGEGGNYIFPPFSGSMEKQKKSFGNI